MKLFLTSNGLSNDSIAQAFADIVGKKPEDTKIAFIPTAAQAERSNKHWLIKDLYRLYERGYYVDIIDLTAVKPEKLKAMLEPFDVIFVGGGVTFYLSYWMQKSGLFDLLPELLKTKVYAGISAGGIMAGRSLVLSSQALKNPEAFRDEDYDILGPSGQSSGKTLGFADLVIRPHLNDSHFALIRKDYIAEKAKQIDWPVYTLDDNSALKIVDGNIEVISEGEWYRFN